jgi:hypothetical protein
MCSSSSLSAPEAVSTTLACSVYTIQHPDCRHAHSLLCLRSKVVCILPSFILCPESQSLTRATPRVHQWHQTLIPLSHIAWHSLLCPLSVLTNHHATVHRRSSCTSRSGTQQSSSQWQGPPSDSLSLPSIDHHQSQCHLLSATICSPLPPLVSATRSPSLEAELTRTLCRTSEVIPIVPEAHLVSFGSASLIRYSYYVPCQYWTHTLQWVATFTPT